MPDPGMAQATPTLLRRDRRVALGCVFFSLRFQAEWGRASALKRRRGKQVKQNKAECNSAIPEYASGFTAGLIASMIS